MGPVVAQPVTWSWNLGGAQQENLPALFPCTTRLSPFIHLHLQGLRIFSIVAPTIAISDSNTSPPKSNRKSPRVAHGPRAHFVFSLVAGCVPKSKTVIHSLCTPEHPSAGGLPVPLSSQRLFALLLLSNTPFVTFDAFLPSR